MLLLPPPILLLPTHMTSMALTRSVLRSSFFFFFRRRRLRSNGGLTRRGDNPEPSSPKVTCIGQVRVKSQKKVKQCRRRINGESSFRSASEPRWVHLPSFSAVLRAWYKFDRCERWWCGGGGGGGREIEEEEDVIIVRKHVFDDIEVIGDRIEVMGRSFEDEFAISVPPKNALLLMRCRSDPIKMAAIANRISSDAARYENLAIQLQQQEQDNYDDETDQEFHEEIGNGEKSLICNNHKIEPEEDEEVESNMSSFEALLETENYQDKEGGVEIEEKGGLPECLVLMMREPKLSMEVSKETWVCATDFIRLHPRRAAADPPLLKKRDKSKPRLPKRNNDAQPPRSSCSLPAAACEPLQLTRCKSEPMTTAAAKLMPKDNVDMDPHTQPPIQVGTAGLG